MSLRDRVVALLSHLVPFDLLAHYRAMQDVEQEAITAREQRRKRHARNLPIESDIFPERHRKDRP